MKLTSFAMYRPRGDGGRFVAGKIDEIVHKAITEWAGKVLATAQVLASVDTGELRASGHIEQSGKAVAVVFDAPHSVYVEFGTGQRGAASAGAGEDPYSPNWPGMPAKPYLRPAFDEHRGEAEGMTREKIAVALS